MSESKSAKWTAKMKTAFRTAPGKSQLLSTISATRQDKALDLATALANDRKTRSQAEFEEARAQEILDGMEKSTQLLQQDIADAVKSLNDREKEALERFDTEAQQALAPLQTNSPECNKKRRELDQKRLELKVSFQRQRDALPTPKPLSHAVSAHGPGTDQVSRLVHGQRGDGKSAATDNTIQLTGNTKGVPDATVTAATNVGGNPSNRAGAFNSATGMLEVSREAFAQADMVSRYATNPTTTSKDIGKDRLAVVVPGADPALGYNVEVEGYMPQKKGVPLAKDEIVARFAAIKRTEEMKSAQMVLDPAYVNVSQPGEEAKFERAGWNLQTAFASDREPVQRYSTPDQVDGSMNDLKARQKSGATLVKRRQRELSDAENVLGGTARLLAFKKLELDKLTDILGGRPQSENLEEKLAEIKKNIAHVDSTIDELSGQGFTLFGSDDPPPELSEDDKKRLAEAEKERATQSALKEQYEAWIKADMRQGEVGRMTAEIEQLEKQNDEQKQTVARLRELSAAANAELAKVNQLIRELPLADARKRVQYVAAELADIERTQAALKEYPQDAKPNAKLGELRTGVAKLQQEIATREKSVGTQGAEAEADLQRLREKLSEQQTLVEQWRTWAWVESLIETVGDASRTFDDLREQLPKAIKALQQQKLAAETDLAALEEEMSTSPVDQGSDEDADEETLSVPGAYNPKTGKYEIDQETGGSSGSKRPEKPSDLKGTDIDGDALTAHHIYPWNKILPDFNKALESGSRAELEKLFAFGQVKMDEEFWEDLKKKPEERSYRFSDAINRAIPKICWSQSNIFMGPSGSKRADDPGENLETVYTDSGLEAPASVMARLAEGSGGLGQPRMRQKPDSPKDAPEQESHRLAELFEANLREAQSGDGQKARPYREEEWTAGADGKLQHRGRVTVSNHPELDTLIGDVAKAVKAFDDLPRPKPDSDTGPDAQKSGPGVGPKPTTERGDSAAALTKEALEEQKRILTEYATEVADDDKNKDLMATLEQLTRRDKAFYDRELIDARTELRKRLDEIEMLKQQLR